MQGFMFEKYIKYGRPLCWKKAQIADVFFLADSLSSAQCKQSKIEKPHLTR